MLLACTPKNSPHPSPPKLARLSVFRPEIIPSIQSRQCNAERARKKDATTFSPMSHPARKPSEIPPIPRMAWLKTWGNCLPNSLQIRLFTQMKQCETLGEVHELCMSGHTGYTYRQFLVEDNSSFEGRRAANERTKNNYHLNLGCLSMHAALLVAV